MSVTYNDCTFIIVQSFVPVNIFLNKRRGFDIMAKYTSFGLTVKENLLKSNPPKTQEWLCKMIRNDLGTKTDSAEVSKILAGKKKSQRVVTSICKILDIPEPEEAISAL